VRGPAGVLAARRHQLSWIFGSQTCPPIIAVEVAQALILEGLTSGFSEADVRIFDQLPRFRRSNSLQVVSNCAEKVVRRASARRGYKINVAVMTEMHQCTNR